MKNIVLILLLLSATCPFAIAQNEYLFADALKEGLVEVQINGNEASTHYIKPLKIVVTNLKKKPIILKIPAGERFISNPAEYQDLLLLQNKIITLEGNAKITLVLYAACTEPSNSSPINSTSFKLEESAAEGDRSKEEDLKKLAVFVDQNKLYGLQETQDAVWFLCREEQNAEEISYIYGSHNNGLSAQKLRSFLYTLKGFPNSDKVAQKENNFSVTDNNVQVVAPMKAILKELKGSCKYQLGVISHVRLAMFNKQGILIREIYDNPESRRGDHAISFAFDATEYQDDLYYFKLIIDEEVAITLKITNFK